MWRLRRHDEKTATEFSRLHQIDLAGTKRYRYQELSTHGRSESHRWTNWEYEILNIQMRDDLGWQVLGTLKFLYQYNTLLNSLAVESCFT
jgi:hypothetical protein